jgi:excisionase family DNA binding protein
VGARHAMLHIIDITAAAELLKCSEETLERRAAAGDLPGLKLGRGWVFPVQALERRLNELAIEEAHARRLRGTPVPAAVQQALPSVRPRRQPPVLADRPL